MLSKNDHFWNYPPVHHSRGLRPVVIHTFGGRGSPAQRADRRLIANNRIVL